MEFMYRLAGNLFLLFVLLTNTIRKNLTTLNMVLNDPQWAEIRADSVAINRNNCHPWKV